MAFILPPCSGIVIYFLGGEGAGSQLFLDGQEASLYLQSDHSTLLVNFSDIYSSAGKEKKQYIDRGEKGCYVYHLRFGSSDRLVHYRHAVFLPSDGLLSDPTLRSGVSSQCTSCPSSDQTGSATGSQICEKVRLEPKLCVLSHDGPKRALNQCISEQSHTAKYDSTLSLSL